MLWITSGAAVLSAGDLIPFNTTVCATNNSATINSAGSVEISEPGWYTARVQAVLSSTDATTVSVQLYAQGNPVNGAVQSVDIPAAGTALVVLEWPVKVLTAASGVAAIDWRVNTPVTIDSATACVKRVI